MRLSTRFARRRVPLGADWDWPRVNAGRRARRRGPRRCVTQSPSGGRSNAFVASAEPRGVLDDRVACRRRSVGRARDHLQDLAVAVCCSRASVTSRLRACELGEQPHVLDGDDGLVGEGLQQLDLLVGEGLDLGLSDVNCADGAPSRSMGTPKSERKPKSGSDHSEVPGIPPSRPADQPHG